MNPLQMSAAVAGVATISAVAVFGVYDRLPVEEVPLISSVSIGCTTNHTFVNYHVITENGSSNTWNEDDSFPDVRIEGWLDGAWHEAPVLKRTLGGLLVEGPYGRWRAYLVQTSLRGHVTRRVIGPAEGPFGDLCAPFVDKVTA